MPFNVEDVVIVTFEARNGHMAMVAQCIYNAVQRTSTLAGLTDKAGGLLKWVCGGVEKLKAALCPPDKISVGAAESRRVKAL